MKYRICKSFDFSYAHRLPYHDGQCARHHGHNGVLAVTVESDALIETGPKRGMVMDFGELSELSGPFIEKYLEHRYLNDTWDNPTAEHLCWFVSEYIKGKLPKRVRLVSVRLWETPTSYAEIGE